MLKKRMILIVWVFMLYLLASPLAVYASTDYFPHACADYFPQASEYIRSTTVEIIPQGNGILFVKNQLGATRRVDKLGIKILKIQTLKNGSWQSIDTPVRNDYLYNASTYIYNFYYNGTPGTQYRSYVEFYVENGGGSETKIVTSTPKTAN
ncbi:MAG: hypothetical protein GX154_10260 [Clostridiales bacterium]|nr:hypothetical protein [Clostridiales bacterium]